MLFIKLCENGKIAQKLSEELFGGQCPVDGNLLFCDDEVVVGFANFSVSCEEVVVNKIGVYAQYESLREFFTRSMLLKFFGGGLPIRIGYVDERFLKLGFRIIENTMYAECEELVFPCECGGDK